MSGSPYNWKRFWSPRNANVTLDAAGYLHDPDELYGAAANREVVPYMAISEYGCLVLLAEPGMGKTQTMEQERATITASIGDQGGRSQWLDLRSFGSEDRLIRNLFESQVWQEWVDSTFHLHVFLDSLDEALLRIDTVAALLADELKKYPVERLSFRIACRTADWPIGFEQELKRLWGEKAVGVFELAPLRRVDVVEAARENKIEPIPFITEVARMQAVPLAIKPVTLNLLLNTYKRRGSFPGTQADLYQEGLRLLCEETNTSRRDARQTGALSAQQRMLVAGRMAAVMVLANKSAIWVGIDEGNVPVDDLTIQALLTSDTSSDNVSISEIAIREALDTGLFSSRGQGRMGWAHQTYAEFLAAWYLIHNKVSVGQIMSLLVHPDDAGGRLVPQLHEMAAWLAGMDTEIFRNITRAEPEVLLRSDVATADAADREILVGNLLTQFDEERIVDRDRSRYSRLAHPKLSEQLRPFICDGTKGFLVRRVAIDIAEACELQSLQGDLLRIVLDPSESEVVRINAAYAIVRIGDEETKAQLKPLALGKIAGDADDELRGCALRAVWPQHITVAELISALDLPHKSRLFGAYDLFISYELAEGLQPEDLPAFLTWFAKQLPQRDLSSSLKRSINKIYIQVWNHLDTPDVINAFLGVVLVNIQHHENLISYDQAGDETITSLWHHWHVDDAKRRRILMTMLAMLSTSHIEVGRLVFSKPPLVFGKDFPWLVERLLASKASQEQAQLGVLIDYVFDVREPEHLETIFAEYNESLVLGEKFRWLVTPILLDSPEADRMKADYDKFQQQQIGFQPALLEPPPEQRIAYCLSRVEQGDLAAWWHLSMELTLETTSRAYGDELEPDLRKLPGWRTADDTTKARMLDAARRYLIEAGPEMNQ